MKRHMRNNLLIKCLFNTYVPRCWSGQQLLPAKLFTPKADKSFNNGFVV